MPTVDLFKGIVAVVQYRRKDEPWWHTMAAYDSRDVAEKYADECSKGDRPWLYQVVDVPEATE